MPSYATESTPDDEMRLAGQSERQQGPHWERMRRGGTAIFDLGRPTYVMLGAGRGQMTDQRLLRISQYDDGLIGGGDRRAQVDLWTGSDAPQDEWQCIGILSDRGKSMSVGCRDHDAFAAPAEVADVDRRVVIALDPLAALVSVKEVAQDEAAVWLFWDGNGVAEEDRAAGSAGR